MAVNYDDKRFTQVETDKNQALNELEQTYAGMIDKSDDLYQQQIDASQQWADKQSQIQQEQTDFAIDKIEQQKEQTHKDYLKEQSGAYVDWQKQSNQYGVNAEQMASAGMTNTGYTESSQVNMYVAYQNRVAKARESYNLAVVNYTNAIKEAQLQNNAALAEIALQAFQEQAKLALEGFQYENQLILDQTSKKIEVDNMYYQRYLDVLEQINYENEYAEKVRQFNQSLALQQAQLAEEKRQFDAQMSYKRSSSGSGGSGSSGSSIKKSSSTSGGLINKYTVSQANDETTNYKNAYNYITKLITSGATKSQVLAEIAIAQKKGELTAAEAAKLKAVFNPKGHQYT